MKASDVLRLNDKVRELKLQIVASDKPMAHWRAKLADDLGFKIGHMVLRETLVHNGLKLRSGNKKDRQIEALRQQVDELRELLEEAVMSVPDSMQTRIKSRLRVVVEEAAA